MKRFYVFDLFKSFFLGKNFCAAIFLILNAYFVCSIFMSIFGTHPAGFLVGFFIYLFSVFVGLSPVGEWFLRKSQGCQKIEDIATLNRLEPLFMEVKERALSKHSDLNIAEKIFLYIKDDEDINAFAVGRRTICVTTGLLALSDEEIKAVIGHEFGHLATHDTDLVLLISTGNFIITAIVSIFKAIITVFKVTMSLVCSFVGGEEGMLASMVTNAAGFVSLLFVDGIIYLWTRFGVWLVMKTSRDAEYEADAFSCDLGYMDGLLSFFKDLAEEERAIYSVKESKDLFAALSSSHPKTQDRIKAIYDRAGTTVM